MKVDLGTIQVLRHQVMMFEYGWVGVAECWREQKIYKEKLCLIEVTEFFF